jgi:hypothetical protein
LPDSLEDREGVRKEGGGEKFRTGPGAITVNISCLAWKKKEINGQVRRPQ